MNTKDMSVTANEVRVGDRIIMRPTWPEGRLVVDVSHGPRDFQLRFTFEGDDEACAFYSVAECVVVRRATGSEVTVPDGFRVVTKQEFFSALYADPRDIMPCIQHSPFYTTWETRGREVWGWSAPGWKNPRDEKIFALKQ
ncbi:hypothetical protein [Burkholderia contaminans]|uniref:Uncharacterized protein n=1 Tax=Burkholderia contaminans TaxID=488447 RepID=A0A3N8QQE6_9BURK|nr:hypothetical protein [Burkholderia contaminans]RQT26024.1 hypothetical protein DF037_20250 [Burkholderia contaminans]